MSKGGERASSVALPQPAANGAFAVVGRSWMVGVMTGSDCAGLCRSGLGVGQVAQTERSGVRRFCGVVCVGLVMSKGGKRASMVALPQPAANGSLCGCGSWLGGRVGCANGAERRAAPWWERFDAGGHSIMKLIFPLDIAKKSFIL